MQEFLRAILAGEGHICITGLRAGDKRPAIHSFLSTVEETDKAIQTFLRDKRDVYFAPATFDDPNAVKPREQSNVKLIKSLWIDVDAGPGKFEKKKGYDDKETVILELERFLEETGLPEPAIVDSGGGVHAYWVLDKELTREEWQPLADGLRELCLEKNFYIDGPCTTDASRILRVPNTFNLKEETPRQVKLLAPPEVAHSIEQISEILPKPKPQISFTPKVKREPSPLTKSLMGNKVSYFRKIILRSLEGDGCPQLLNIYQNQADIGYDLWRCGLSIANFCQDRDTAIHKISKKHPNYSPEETEEKASDTAGPFYCETFEGANPGGCEGCTHRGNITTPIVLGTEILESKDKEIEVKIGEEESEVVVYDVPPLPEPYFRGKNGGIFVRDKSEGHKVIYPHDLFVVQRIDDSNEGESAWLRVHLPLDGVKNFTVPMASLTSVDSFRTELSKRGVLTTGKNGWLDIQTYVISCAQNLQIQRKAETAHHQFGWTKKNGEYRDTFVVGDMELDLGKLRYVPPTASTSDMVEWFRVKGTLDNWKTAFHGYSKPGLEPQAFAALTAFGAPLLSRATNHKGVLLNLMHTRSGTGKTTVLRVINSVWGHPEDPLRSPDDTKSALVQRMGVLNNIPLAVDELTNLKPEEVSNFLYGITQGRGRDRMKADSNSLRKNNTTWRTIGVATSNASFYDKLHSIKDIPEGEMFRCVEYNIDPGTSISTKEGIELFDNLLMENYGHAWIPYMTAVQTNLDSVIERVKREVDKINEELKLGSNFRFYSALGAVNIVGGMIARELDLIDYPFKEIRQFYLDTISQTKHVDSDEDRDDYKSFISHFILKHMAQNTLVVDSTTDARTGNICSQTPRGELLIRMEPDTKKIFLLIKAIREECSTKNVPYKEVLKGLKKKDLLIEVAKKGMSKGTHLNTPPVSVLVLDAERMGVDIENVVGQNKIQDPLE